MPSLGPTELIIIGLIVILLFGAKKLPDTARALGQSLRLFKKETKKMNDEDEESTVVKAQAETVPPPPAQIPPVVPAAANPATPSVEDRLRTLEEENAKLRASQADKQN
ncbi:Sec-independent protein translocase subunit TatA [Acrocarpospora sp. B8E8]|uniref:Sec-independent protein translocase subunit TatA n=1 Tax=Acrocarpospora sp. B8E8 TaxID=3153572 RepID=UPI00325F8AC9